jgi:type II secretory pathway pseudopilin PulG
VSTLAIIVVIAVLLLLALIAGGIYITGRRARDSAAELRNRLHEANRALALARAQDKGWERTNLEHAARAAFAERSPAEIRELHLVQVVDRPGTDEDQAVFQVVTDHGAEYLHLGRRGDTWVAEHV